VAGTSQNALEFLKGAGAQAGNQEASDAGSETTDASQGGNSPSTPTRAQANSQQAGQNDGKASAQASGQGEAQADAEAAHADAKETKKIAEEEKKKRDQSKVANDLALAKAKNLKDYFISMRGVYHHQFLKSGLDVNDTTIGFLPANASTFISDEFAKLSGNGTAIRNVTDRARNEKNQADKFELEAIEYFKKNPNETMLVRKIEQNGRNLFNFTSQLVI
jgi:hypothetical protein